VKFKDRLREPPDVVHSHGLRFADHCPSGGEDLDALDARYHVVGFAPVFASWFGTATAGPGRGVLAERRKLLHAAVARTRAAFAGRSRRAPENAEVPDLTGVYYVEVPAGTDLGRMALDYASNENVEYAVPDPLVEATALPDDPYLYTTGSWGQGYSDLWAIQRIGAPAAWDTATGLGVVVAVVDTGLDYAHVDIASSVWTNEAEANGAPGVDDDANGYVDDVRGWDFAYGNADVLDRNGRGTSIAGVIAATGDNAAGVVGVAYQSRIMPVKALADYGSGYLGNVANAIVYAARNGADVINNSYGCRYCKSPLVTDAVALARSLGCVVTTGAGNDGADAKYQFPGNLADMITVASTGQDDGRSSFSNFGHLVDVAAPGGGPGSGAALYDILTLRAAATGYAGYVVGTDYIRTAGTSLAAAHVSGTAALLLSANPGLSVAQVESIIRHTAADQVGDPLVDLPGFDPGYGWGRLDAAAAVARAFDPPPDPPVFEVIADPLEFVLPQSTCPGPWSLPLDIYNVGGGRLSWSASGPGWLTVTPASGTAPSLSVRASVDPLSSRSGTLTISPLDAAAGAPVDLPVSEQVLSSVRIVNCDAAIARWAGTQDWAPSLYNTSPPGIPDGAGGAFYAWTDARSSMQVFTQRVDSLGRPLWAASGVPLTPASQLARAPAIIGDGSGGAIVAFVQDANYSSSTGHIRAQRVDASGRKLWGANGVSVCDVTGVQLEPKLVPDGAGGAIVAWTDLRNGTQNADVYAQRLDSSGNGSWQTGGVPVASAASSQRKPVMVADGSGGAILAWRDDTIADRTVFAQRIDGAGSVLWAPGGIQIATLVDEPGIVTDGRGGAIIAWNDYRSSASRVVGDIYAARVDGAGNQLWAPGGAPVVVGVTVGAGAYEPGVAPAHVTLASDGKGGAFVVWHDQRNGKDWDIYGQRLDPDGNRLWGGTGVPVTSAATNQTCPAVISDGGDGAIFAWTDFRAGNADIFLQRLGATGSRLLGPNGLWLEGKFEPDNLPKTSIAYAGGQYAASLVPLANHRLLVTWDDRSSTATDLVGKVIEFASDVAIAPGAATVPPNGVVSFSATGGSGGGWTWSLATNASGGAIDAGTGEYVAGRTGGVSDVVQVRDSWGILAARDVTVTAGLSIAPATATAPPRARMELAPSGGSGTGYEWSFVTNGSGGSIETGTGVYRAGPTGSAVDVVRVTDSLGNTASASIALTAGVSLAPSAPTVAPRGGLWLEAEGGSGAGYVWSFVTNASGGSIVSYTSTAGVYEAGPVGGVTDVVEVADSLGNRAAANVEVTAGISITPSSPTVAPLSSVELAAAGGSGEGYIWLFSVDESGGSIDPTSGAYRAGPKGDAVDLVYVIDSLGNRASVDVTVTPAVPSPPPADDPGGCGCRNDGGGGASLALAAALFLVAQRRARRRTALP
jgi:subtilisin family serine protease